MAKVRQTTRYEPDVTQIKVDPKKVTAEEFGEDLKEFFTLFATERPRTRTLWYQSLMQFANERFHTNYDKEMK